MKYLYIVYTPDYSYKEPKSPQNCLSRHRKMGIAKAKAMRFGIGAEIWREWETVEKRDKLVFRSIHFEPYKIVARVNGQKKLVD